MKKLLLILCCAFSGGAWAEACDDESNSFDTQKCLSIEVRTLKNELNTVYNKLYNQTEAKKELDSAQKS